MLDEFRRKPGARTVALSCARMQSFDLGDRRFRLISRRFWRYELEHLLRRAGFASVEMFGDLDRSTIRRDSPAHLVVAR